MNASTGGLSEGVRERGHASVGAPAGCPLSPAYPTTGLGYAPSGRPVLSVALSVAARGAGPNRELAPTRQAASLTGAQGGPA